jgi:hypothetical protein
MHYPLKIVRRTAISVGSSFKPGAIHSGSGKQSRPNHHVIMIDGIDQPVSFIDAA